MCDPLPGGGIGGREDGYPWSILSSAHFWGQGGTGRCQVLFSGALRQLLQNPAWAKAHPCMFQATGLCMPENCGKRCSGWWVDGGCQPTSREAGARKFGMGAPCSTGYTIGSKCNSKEGVPRPWPLKSSMWLIRTVERWPSFNNCEAGLACGAAERQVGYDSRRAAEPDFDRSERLFRQTLHSWQTNLGVAGSGPVGLRAFR